MSTQTPAKRSTRRPVGAVSATGARRTPLRWLPWAALLLLALLAAAVVLIVTNVTDENDQPGIELRDDEIPNADEPGSTGRRDSTASSTSPATAPTAAPTTTAAAVSAGTPSPTTAAGALAAGDVALLPVSPAALVELSGQAVTGQGVVVESVVADEGFWVGSGPADRLFVHLGEEARAAEGESPFQVAAGQRIDLQGVLQPLTADPLTELGVDDAEGSAQLQEQAHYIEATQVTLR